MSNAAHQPILPENPTTEDAISYVQGLVRWIGPGFHPDTCFQDYVRLPGGEPLLPKKDAEALNAELERAMATLDSAGEDVYDIGLKVIHRIVGGGRRKCQ